MLSSVSHRYGLPQQLRCLVWAALLGIIPEVLARHPTDVEVWRMPYAAPRCNAQACTVMRGCDGCGQSAAMAAGNVARANMPVKRPRLPPEGLQVHSVRALVASHEDESFDDLAGTLLRSPPCRTAEHQVLLGTFGCSTVRTPSPTKAHALRLPEPSEQHGSIGGLRCPDHKRGCPCPL